MFRDRTFPLQPCLTLIVRLLAQLNHLLAMRVAGFDQFRERAMSKLAWFERWIGLSHVTANNGDTHPIAIAFRRSSDRFGQPGYCSVFRDGSGAVSRDGAAGEATAEAAAIDAADAVWSRADGGAGALIVAKVSVRKRFCRNVRFAPISDRVATSGFQPGRSMLARKLWWQLKTLMYGGEINTTSTELSGRSRPSAFPGEARAPGSECGSSATTARRDAHFRA